MSRLWLQGHPHRFPHGEGDGFGCLRAAMAGTWSGVPSEPFRALGHEESPASNEATEQPEEDPALSPLSSSFRLVSISWSRSTNSEAPGLRR